MDAKIHEDYGITKSSYWIKMRIVLKGVNTLKSIIRETGVQTDGCQGGGNSVASNTACGVSTQTDKSTGRNGVKAETSSSNSNQRETVISPKDETSVSARHDKLSPAKKSSSNKYPTIGKLLNIVRPCDELLGQESRNNIQNVPWPADKVALSDRIKSVLQGVFTRSTIKDKQEFEKQLNNQIVSHIEVALRKYLDELRSKKLVSDSDDHLVDCDINGDIPGSVVKQIVMVKITCSNLVVEKAMAVAVDHSSIHYDNGGRSNLSCGCKINSSCATHGAGR